MDKGVSPTSLTLTPAPARSPLHHVRVAAHDGVEERIHNSSATSVATLMLAPARRVVVSPQNFGTDEPDVAQGRSSRRALFSRQSRSTMPGGRPYKRGENGIDLKSGINQSAGDGDVISHGGWSSLHLCQSIVMGSASCSMCQYPRIGLDDYGQKTAHCLNVKFQYHRKCMSVIPPKRLSWNGNP